MVSFQIRTVADCLPLFSSARLFNFGQLAIDELLPGKAPQWFDESERRYKAYEGIGYQLWVLQTSLVNSMMLDNHVFLVSGIIYNV